MGRFVSFTSTCIVAGAIGFGFGLYTQPSRQADQFRSLIGATIDAIRASLQSEEPKPDIRADETPATKADAEAAAPAARADAPPAAADGTESHALVAPAEQDKAPPGPPDTASAEAAPPAPAPAPAAVPAPSPAPSQAPAAKKAKPKAAPKADQHPN